MEVGQRGRNGLSAWPGRWSISPRLFSAANYNNNRDQADHNRLRARCPLARYEHKNAYKDNQGYNDENGEASVSSGDPEDLPPSGSSVLTLNNE
jgi:hypothetical protein